MAHGLHRVAEEIRQNFSSDVDRLISNVKKIVVKAALRMKNFKEIAPSLPLPPEPITTRWGMWLSAVQYYCENYEDIKKIGSTFDSSDASSIKIVQQLFSSSLLRDLAYIKSNYGGMAKSISNLEAIGLELHKVWRSS